MIYVAAPPRHADQTRARTSTTAPSVKVKLGKPRLYRCTGKGLGAYCRNALIFNAFYAGAAPLCQTGGSSATITAIACRLIEMAAVSEPASV